RAASSYVEGALCGAGAAAIWAGWSAVTRAAVTNHLDAWDIAALRFAVAGIVLLPVVLARGLARDRLGWRGLGVLIAGAGAPYVVLAAGGLSFAPARDQGVLNPGIMPVFVACIGASALGEPLSRDRTLGLAIILASALLIIVGHAPPWPLERALGQA